MRGHSKKSTYRKTAVLRNSKRDSAIPRSNIEQLRIAIVWVHFRAPLLRKLAKVVLRVVCSYVYEEIAIIYSVFSQALYIYSIPRQEAFVIEFRHRFNVSDTASAVALDNAEVFLCGGRSSCHAANRGASTSLAFTVHIDGTITALARMQVSRFMQGIVAYRKKVMVFGGSHGDLEEMSDLSKCEEYLLEEDRWSALPDMHLSRYWCSATRLGEHLYIFGGDTSLIIEVFGLLSNTFRMTKLCLPSQDVCFAFVRDSTLVVLDYTHRVTIKGEDGTESMEIAEEWNCWRAANNSKYWKGQVYYYENGQVYCIEGDGQAK